MNILVLKKDVFDIESDFSNGLIYGLKKLSRFSFVFSTDAGIESALIRICNKESIELISSEEGIYSRRFILTNKTLSEVDSSGKTTFTETVDNAAQAADRLISILRSSRRERVTKETEIKLELQIDGEGRSKINTGIGFFDHMLEQIVRHSNINMELFVNGDLNVDEHHTIEDVGIILGEALSEALGNKTGIQRYGFVVPMDESVAVCSIDLSGRSRLNFNCEFKREKVGEMPTELVEEFFHGLSSGLKANIYIKCEGKNDHHKIESIFKGFAKALNEACRFDERNNGRIPSTKGVI